MSLITAQEFETLTNASFTAYPTDYVQAVLDTASDHLENWCSRMFALTDIVDEMSRSHVTRGGWLKVNARYKPIVSVSGLKFQFAGSTDDIDLSNADIDLELGTIMVLWYRPLLGGPDEWITLLSYRVGSAAVPDPIRLAVALLAREAVQADDQAAQEGLAYPLESYKVGSYSETYAIRRADGAGDLGLGTELSLRARALALPYRRAGIL